MQALQAMTGDEQERLLREAVAKAVAEGSRRWPDRLWGASIQLEEERLRRLLRRWLVVEEERQLPFQVEAQERDGHCHPLGRLHLTLRPDRVDLLADGERIILDYKTGRPEPGDWFGERPRDPQLPLYCLAAAEPVAAVAFVRMRPEQVGFKGLAREAGLLPGVKGLDVAARYELTSWEAIQDHWREGLHRLADEFLAGVATVSPQPKACDLCDLGPLCRIGETELGEESVAAMEEE